MGRVTWEIYIIFTCPCKLVRVNIKFCYNKVILSLMFGLLMFYYCINTLINCPKVSITLNLRQHPIISQYWKKIKISLYFLLLPSRIVMTGTCVPLLQSLSIIVSWGFHYHWCYRAHTVSPKTTYPLNWELFIRRMYLQECRMYFKDQIYIDFKNTIGILSIVDDFAIL